ncbi:sulfur oxidation c-type cytochrome SoxA [Undibacterium sp. TS12]|uniref:sulfur oxidation c-type cytochrome SoxA n=1 Tax=Undibacterium sp. TS12 TaxID=2908202 RepID=UPI001F4D32DC|nr:sulfur oxidation c-type cytochrome SoxA [Undibacterium sp. TS12]MCH8622581.1 sulfur oxidation c-type cytochrome SoxA [Undibacterium sp. TS12]
MASFALKTLMMTVPLVAVLATPALVQAQATTSSTDEIAKYREMLADGNPAELWEMRGQELWKKKAGPSQQSLEQCDLGKGPGVTKGAYAELPRYFKDANKVMDLEQRLMYCRMNLQGLTREQASKTPFGSAGNPSDIEAMVSFLTAESRGIKLAVSTKHPAEKQAYEIGKKIFYYRAGSHDFACASCHSTDGQRIRLQDLPNLNNKANAQAAYSTWPAYRVSQGEVRTMQHRLNDCFRQQRFPVPDYASDSITALTMFLAKSAEGAVMNAPALKR